MYIIISSHYGQLATAPTKAAAQKKVEGLKTKASAGETFTIIKREVRS